MKTIYGLYWKHIELGEEIMASTTWLEERGQADTVYAQLLSERVEDLMLFSFEVEDDATEREISDLLDEFVVGRTHLVDLGATVLQ